MDLCGLLQRAYGVHTVQIGTLLTPWKTIFMDHFPCVTDKQSSVCRQDWNEGEREGIGMRRERLLGVLGIVS